MEHPPPPPHRRPDDDPATDAPSAVECDICRGPMFDFHCRLICSNCGFQRDCSDP